MTDDTMRRGGTRRVGGTVRVPGDKSISHRALILAGLAAGRSRVSGLLCAQDVGRTRACLEAWGVRVEDQADGRTLVESPGREGFREPDTVLDCGNSGTSARLLLGVAASLPFAATFVGDASLSSRPMGRVTGPLALAGARFLGRAGATRLPITVQGGHLGNLDHELPVASAQIKSALLLAATGAAARFSLVEPARSRDHTERMLAARGVRIEQDGDRMVLEGPQPVAPADCVVPGDPSSAAFFVVAGLLAGGGGGPVVLPGVGLNPTRSAFLEVLERMGARIVVEDATEIGGEPIGTLVVRASELEGTEIAGVDLIPRLIDEIPILAVAASLARGRTVIRDAGELRAKESDRIRSLARELPRLGARVTELPDGLEIEGVTELTGAAVESHRDHRIAMSLAIAALRARGTTTLIESDCVRISYPTFFEDLDGIEIG